MARLMLYSRAPLCGLRVLPLRLRQALPELRGPRPRAAPSAPLPQGGASPQPRDSNAVRSNPRRRRCMEGLSPSRAVQPCALPEAPETRAAPSSFFSRPRSVSLFHPFCFDFTHLIRAMLISHLAPTLLSLAAVLAPAAATTITGTTATAASKTFDYVRTAAGGLRICSDWMCW